MARSDGMDNDPWNASQPSDLFYLPVELLKQVISYLPVYSQASFMVNRFIRPICEECLYDAILLAEHPQRSLRLLKTFVLRPDLALRVHKLSIDASGVEYTSSGKTLGGSNFDRATALSLAKNLHYLSISVSGNWLRKPQYSSLRKAIFNMKLKGLTLPYVIEWTLWNDLRASWNIRDRSEDMVHDIRSLLQAQPQLEHLSFMQCGLSDEVLSILKANLLSSDVPSLKSLEANQNVAIPFMAAAPGLESLKLKIIGKWDDTILSQLEGSSIQSRSSLRRLAVKAWSPDAWISENFARVFALLPNLEALKVWIWVRSEGLDVTSAEYYFNMVYVPSVLAADQF
ncbi:hypothetical protein FRC01_014068 [Tulasnella sp. 417]|nr:hypothetical protein FRC01_014068 [Tulasnella sp. 417]